MYMRSALSSLFTRVGRSRLAVSVLAGTVAVGGITYARQMDFMKPPPRPEPLRKEDLNFSKWDVFHCDPILKEEAVRRTRLALLGLALGGPSLCFLTRNVPILQYTIAGFSVLAALAATGFFLTTRKALIHLTLHEDMQHISIERGPVTLSRYTFKIKDLNMLPLNPMAMSTEITVKGKDLEGRTVSFYLMPLEAYEKFQGQIQNPFLLHAILKGEVADVQKFKFVKK